MRTPYPIDRTTVGQGCSRVNRGRPHRGPVTYIRGSTGRQRRSEFADTARFWGAPVMPSFQRFALGASAMSWTII